MSQNKLELSIVIPLFNEEKSIPILFRELSEVLEKLNKEYEVIIVDDGSTDGSWDELCKLHEKDNHFKAIKFRKNFGQTAAIQAGFDNAQGSIIVTLDSDLENDPKNIPLLLAKLDEGYDIVSGWRSKRWAEGIIPYIKRKLPSVTANLLISKMSGVKLHDTGCTLKAYRREVIEQIRLYGDMHRFIPAVANLYGARVTEVEVNYRTRRFGSSKYGFSRTLKVFLDIILIRFMLVFFTKPLQFFGTIGMLSASIGMLLGLYLTYIKLLGENIGERPLLQLASLLLVLGVQLVMMGILGEVIVRTYYESQGKKTYAISKKCPV